SYKPVVSARPEGHPDKLQQLPRLFVGPRRRDHGNVHAAGLVHFHVIDLGEQQLVAKTQRIVAAAVETLGRHALEVADARQRDVHQPIEEFPHALAAQRHHGRDRLALADLELRDRFLRAPRDGSLPGDARNFVGARVDELRIRRRLAEAHVHDDLLDLRHGHDVLVAELLLERGHHILLILLFQPGHLSTTPSHLRQMRTLRPSPRSLWPTRVWTPHSGHTSCTFDACSDASRDTMPPWTCLPGFGFVWRLIMFTPSTMSRIAPCSPGSTFRTRPRLPRSLPVMTSTLSFFRIGVANLDIRLSTTASTNVGRVLSDPPGPKGPGLLLRSSRSLRQTSEHLRRQRD